MHYTPPADTGLELIYCDESLLVVNKPAGLLTVPGRGEDKQDCQSVRVQRDFPDALIVHRLDMATSGLLLFARGALMQSRLSAMFREREIEKRYVAIVEGTLETDTGEVNLPIATDWLNRPLRKIDAQTGKASLTRYRVLSRNADTTRVELEPYTGRTHQLRVHMKAVGHPILGDALYGDPLNMHAAEQFVRTLAREAGKGIAVPETAPRLLLHALSLDFNHPVSLAQISLACPAAF